MFRERGYDGATLTALAEATGLERASLYHYFPGGKEAMAEAALSDVEDQLEATLLAPLRQGGTITERVEGMVRALDGYYNGGRSGCLLAALALNRSDHQLGTRVAASFEAWAKALTALAIEAGVPNPQVCAEDIIVLIQGGLVLSAGLSDPSPFRRALQRVVTLMAGSDEAPSGRRHQ